MVLIAGRAAFEMRAHTRDLLVGGCAGELELDVAVELVEALLAGQLGPAGRGAGQGVAGAAVGSGHERLPSLR